jgi:hypothetical protein
MAERTDAPACEPLVAVQRLAEDHALCLSSDDRLAKRFHALIRIAFHARDGVRATGYLVQRDDQRVAVLMLSDDGLPFCYMSNGFLAAFNADKPGHLLVHEGGSPSCTLNCDVDTGRGSCNVGYASNGGPPRVLLDFPAILSACSKLAHDATLDRDKGEIVLKTRQATVSIELAPAQDAHGFPIKLLTMLGVARDSLAVGPIGLESEPAVNLMGIDRGVVDGLEIPYRRLTGEQASRLDVIVPPRFGTNQLEKQAAQRLMTLFPPRRKSND